MRNLSFKAHSLLNQMEEAPGNFISDTVARAYRDPMTELLDNVLAKPGEMDGLSGYVLIQSIVNLHDIDSETLKKARESVEIELQNPTIGKVTTSQFIEGVGTVISSSPIKQSDMDRALVGITENDNENSIGRG